MENQQGGSLVGALSLLHGQTYFFCCWSCFTSDAAFLALLPLRGKKIVQTFKPLTVSAQQD